MKASIRFLLFASAFGFVVGGIYWFVTYDEVGTTLLLFMGAAALIIGGYLYIEGRHHYPPEDDPSANMADSAGKKVGHFSGGSLWPILMGIGIAVGIEGFVFGRYLLVTGLLLFAWATIGLMQESKG